MGGNREIGEPAHRGNDQLSKEELVGRQTYFALTVGC